MELLFLGDRKWSGAIVDLRTICEDVKNGASPQAHLQKWRGFSTSR